MTQSPKTQIPPSEESGVDDVRAVRDKISQQYNGDLRKHVADTERLVEPLIQKLGLKRGAPPRGDDRRSGTEG